MKWPSYLILSLYDFLCQDNHLILSYLTLLGPLSYSKKTRIISNNNDLFVVKFLHDAVFHEAEKFC